MRFNKETYFARMNYRMTAKDWLLHLVVTPSLVVLANYWLLGPVYFSRANIFIAATLITAVVALLLSLGNMRSMYAVRRSFPALNQTAYRLLLSFLLYAFLDFVGVLTILLLYDYLPLFQFTITAEKVVKSVIVLLVAATIAGLGYEFFYTFEKWKESIRENEKLQRLQLQTELNVLKSQVNPHFLFNSLNSLSYLISDDAEKAEAYLNEMTKVYRYLLRNNEVELTNLATELQFIKSYYHLLKTRYGSGIELHISIEPGHEAFLLPPLTLQLLVENAVKHNTVHKDQPLLIRIYTNTQQQLVVQNNLQKKTVAVESNKVGLSNIAAKYKLLKQGDILVQQTTDAFSVTLPLITNELALAN